MINMFRNRMVIILLALTVFLNCGKKGTEPEPGPEPAPRITSGPDATSITDKSATIAWITDQKTDSQVKYGKSAGNYDGTVSSEELTTDHSLTLSNLEVFTSYYYIVTSSNANGTNTSAEKSFTTQVNSRFLLTRAWSKFEQGQYEEALADFEAALSISVNLSDAYVGLGWSYAFLGSLDDAKKQFDNAISIDKQLLDAYVGRGMVFLAKHKYYLSLGDLTHVLEENAAYVFSHNTTIDYRDVHIALAEAYFYQGKYSNAQGHVDVLWPDNGLSPGESATWVVDSVSYATYQEALLSAIEKLKTLVQA